MQVVRSLVVLLALAGAPLAQAQNVTHRPEGLWRSVTTDHFRLHYPLAAEEWALEVAGQLDGIRDRVSEEIGFAPPKRIQLVVMDPFRDANGFALPFLGRPRMGVFATPPGASSALGNYRSWAEDLVVHEDAHLVHLLRPTRSPFRGFFSRLLGVGPVTRLSPAWVTEGYATVVEGRLTGRGRPNSDYRATMLRSLAQEGRMPGYYELNGGGRWASGRFRYLVGSAYLEWLEAQGDGELPDLWMRMSARKKRDFASAFEGVFGDDPEVLYGRYVAELTRDAMAIESARPAHEGTLFADLYQSTGAPTVSADGKRLAAVVAEEDGPSRLVVWSTEPDPEAQDAWDEAVEALLEKDPEDVPADAPDVFPPEEVARRVRNDRFPVAPRFLPDGRLLFSAWTRNGQGFARPDLYIWDPEGGEERVTRGASLIEADPHPDGTRAFAVRTDWGVQSIVEVDLATGAWADVTEPGTAVVDAPRVSPDGTQLAYLVTAGQDWSLRIRDLATGEEREVPVPEATIPADPSWLPDGSGLVVSWGHGGFIELAIVGRGEPEVLTVTRGGAYSPVVGDGEVFFLTMDADGLDIRRMPLPNGAEGQDDAKEAPVTAEQVPGRSSDDLAEGEAPADAPPDDAITTSEVVEGMEPEPAPLQATGSSEEGGEDPAGGDESLEVAPPLGVAPATMDAAPAGTEPGSVASASEGGSEDPAEIPTTEAAPDLSLVGPLALRPEPPPPQPFPAVETVEPARYGIGSPQVRPLAGLTVSPHHASAHLLLSAQDVAGKVDVLVAAGHGLPKPGGVDGYLLAMAWRGPLRLDLTRFSYRERRGSEERGELGLAGSLARDLRWASGSASLRLGGLYGASRANVSRARRFAHLDGDVAHRVWLGTAAIQGDLGGHAALGDTEGRGWQRAEGHARLGFGGRSWLLSGRGALGTASSAGGADGFRLGGIAHTLVPEVTQLGQVLLPAFAPYAASGRSLASVSAELEVQGATLAWERHRVGGATVELLSASSGVTLEPTALVGVPGVEVEGGLSCVLRDLGGAVQAPCTRLEDYAAWATVVWRP